MIAPFGLAIGKIKRPNRVSAQVASNKAVLDSKTIFMFLDVWRYRPTESRVWEEMSASVRPLKAARE